MLAKEHYEMVSLQIVAICDNIWAKDRRFEAIQMPIALEVRKHYETVSGSWPLVATQMPKT